mmetsp:Transcript_25131/g.36941  ORF Transcript_25131/g.36941 Transcript_25131/m.36941 type:complete len:267 (+) Transcript_25131:52-852(+)
MLFSNARRAMQRVVKPRFAANRLGSMSFFSSDDSKSEDSDEKLSTTTVGKSTNIRFHESTVPREVRQELINQRGCILWMTGLSGSGKSTVAYTLERALMDAGKLCYVLDGDNIRTGLNSNVGFSAEDRAENIRRVSEVAKLFADAGIVTIVSFISPYTRDRQLARHINAPSDANFVEVFMDIPIEVCEQRDPKGLYVKARAGLIKGFTGIDDPYEPPENPEITIKVMNDKGEYNTPESMAKELYEYLDKCGFLGPVRRMPWDPDNQ